MLSKKQTALLTAYVDGELSDQKRKLVERLLRKSPPARKLLSELEKDSRELAALPRKSAPSNLSSLLVERLTKADAASRKSPASVSATTQAAERQIPSWLGLTMAASVLVAVTVASYLYFSDRFGPDRNGIASQGHSDSQKKNGLPGDKQKDAITPPESQSLEFALADVNRQNIRRQLNDRLRKGMSFHIELANQSNKKTVNKLKTIMQDRGIDLRLESSVKKTLSQKKHRKYLLYLEDVFPEEVELILFEMGRAALNETEGAKTVHILGQIAASQAVTFTGTPAIRVAQFVVGAGPGSEVSITPLNDRLVLDFLTEDQRLQVAERLRIDPDQLQPAKPADPDELPPPNIDIPIIPGHQKANKGKHSGGKKTLDRVAFVLAYDEDAQGTELSKELEAFRKRRSEERPDGTLQLVIVLNEVAV